MQPYSSRPEHPRPQMVRDSWLNLNGAWGFAFDFGRSGRARGAFSKEGRAEAGFFDKVINVPFCPESPLSGIGYTDFMPAVWYKNEVVLTEEQCRGRVLLHFGAVDYFAEVWVNGTAAGSHKGGYSSFTVEITGLARPGGNVITVCAEDDNRSGRQPRGKQCAEYYSRGCDYTRTTGIWQTVWLEFVPVTYIKSYKATPDPANSRILLDVAVDGCPKGKNVEAEASFDGKPVGKICVKAVAGGAHLCLPLDVVNLWDVGAPNLYDLKISLTDADYTAADNDEDGSGAVLDSVDGYFGLRTVGWHDRAFYINGRPVFMRLVLDQGFYPDGIYTAPDDAALVKDIEISMALGFNGARLHEKVFEERFLYHADKMGYIVWGEMANWGLDISTPAGLEAFLPEWMETLGRDYNHPSIIGWCPFNETGASPSGARQDGEVLKLVYDVTKMYDATRPVIDTSGYIHVATDIFDIHWYEQDVAVFKEKFGAMQPGGAVFDPRVKDQAYGGQPYFVSEYGGTWWNKPADDAGDAGGGGDKGQNRTENWGYGLRPQSEAEVLERYTGMTGALLGNRAICGFCYTQLYDIEQEQNGLYAYDRSKKFTDGAYAAITECNKTAAAIEK